MYNISMAKMNALFFFQMYRISMGYLISISVLGFLFNMAIIILFLAVKKVRQTSHVFTLIDLYFRKYQLFLSHIIFTWSRFIFLILHDKTTIYIFIINLQFWWRNRHAILMFNSNLLYAKWESEKCRLKSMICNFFSLGGRLWNTCTYHVFKMRHIQ